jgi:protein arginine kinase activator
MTYDDFRKVGRLGCAECYPTFKRSLGSLLKRIHGSPMHVGKSPLRLLKSSKVAKSELLELKRKLEKAIEQEAFEEAARLRDQIRRLEQQEQQAKQKGQH